MQFIELVNAHGVLGFLAEISIKGTIILGSAALASVLLKSASASVRHLVWSTALVLLLVLPVFVAFVPSYHVPVLPPELEPLTRFEAPAAVKADDEIASSLSIEPFLETERRSERSTRRELAELPRVTAPSPARGVEAVTASVSPSPDRPLDWRLAVFALWMIGALMVSLRYALGWVALRRIERRAIPVSDVRLRLLVKRTAGAMGLRRRIRVVWGSPGSMPLTFGCIHPTVLLPEEAKSWDAERLMVVLRHELAHIKRWDCLVQAIVYVACTLYWFNPIVWIAAAQSHREREMACDDYVLESGSRGADYAGHLLEIARSLQGPRYSGVTTIAMARRSELEGRLLAILSTSRRRERTTAQSVLATFAVLGCLVMTVAALRPVAMKAAEAHDLADVDTVSAVDPGADESSRESSSSRIESRISDEASMTISAEIDDQYVAEASAIVERAAATLEASLNRLIPRTVRLNGSLVANVEASVGLSATGQLDIVRADTIPLEQIRRLRNAGVDVDFIQEMAKVGFDRLTVEQLISLAHAGVDAEYVRRLREAGFTDLDPADLADLGFAGVDVDDIQVWAELGYQNLSSRDLIRLAHAGVDPVDVRAFAEAGYSGLSPSELVQFGHAGIDPEFIRQMQESGFTDLSARELIRLSHADVDVRFIREMRDAGYSDLSAEELIRLSHADVDPQFIRQMAEMGLSGLSTEDLVHLGHADVDADFIAEMKAAGYDVLDVNNLVALSHADVDASFIRELGDLGLKDLRVSDLIKLGHADIDAVFIRDMRKSGYADLDVDELIQIGYAGVDPGYIAELAMAGVTGLAPMDLVQLSHADIDADVVADLRNAGLTDLSTADLIQLGFADVDGDYIKELASVGLTGLSATELVMLAHSDVDADDVRQMREMGLDANDPEKILQFKHMDIDPDYVERIRRALER